jgi:hypothetical protein
MPGLTFEVDPLPAGLVDVYAEIDDGSDPGGGSIAECLEDNNLDRWSENLCPE